jgi:hypothetical protein
MTQGATKYERIFYTPNPVSEEAIEAFRSKMLKLEGLSLSRSAALKFFADRGAQAWLENQRNTKSR